MRGFLSFLLVFFALLSILYIKDSFIELQSYNQANPVIIEKLYQIEMNLKEVVSELARQGAREAFLEYALEITLSEGGLSSFDIQEAKNRMRQRIYEKFQELDNYLDSTYNDDIDISFWCTDSYLYPNDLVNTKLEMRELKKAKPCSSCNEISEMVCKDQINVEIDLMLSDLNKSKLTVDISKFGFSLYSKDYDLSSIGYIPKVGKVEIG